MVSHVGRFVWVKVEIFILCLYRFAPTSQRDEAAGDALKKRIFPFLNLDGVTLGLAFQKQRPVLRKG